MVKLKSSGNYNKTAKFLQGLSKREVQTKETDLLFEYAQELMTALSEATPKDSGQTALSWDYTIRRDHGNVYLDVYNTNINDGVCIALLLQYGHATRDGGYVQGVDYINPAAKPIFDKIERLFWKEVVT